MLACIVATGLFSSCQKEVVATTVTYELNGTAWEGRYSIPVPTENGRVVEVISWTYSFTSKDAGERVIINGSRILTCYFTYEMDGDYGFLSHSNSNSGFGEIIPDDAEIHIIDKNHISIGGWVHTRK